MSGSCTAVYQLFVAGSGSRREGSSGEDCELEIIRTKCLDIARTHEKGYVWHLEGFKLQAHRAQDGGAQRLPGFIPSDSAQLNHLWGTTCYGDNVEDEWFIFWLLQRITVEASSHFGVELVARCWDDDGEFVLIESADKIPNWIQPDTATNRVFIRGGKMRVLCHRDGNQTETTSAGGGNPKAPVGLELSDALSILSGDSGTPSTHSRHESESDRVSRLVASVVDDRLGGYPGKAEEMQHRCVCQLSKRAALLLERWPRGIAQATHFFFNRGPEGVKILDRLCKKNQSESGRVFLRTAFDKNVDGDNDGVVLVRTRMNRSHYAQLMQATFSPPKGFLPSLPHKSSPWFLAADLGAKITCGLELFHFHFVRKMRVEGTLEGLDASDVDWEDFRKRLETMGYFENEREGSSRHKALTKEAKRAFLSKREVGGDQEKAQREEEVLFQEIGKILSMEREGGEGLYHELETRCEDLNSGDSDAWLYNGAELMEEAMKSKTPGGGSDQGQGQGRGQGQGMEDMVSEMETFVNHVSSFEGAEIPHGGGGPHPVESIDPMKFFQEISRAIGFDGMEELEREAMGDGHLESSYFFSEDSQEESEEIDDGNGGDGGGEVSAPQREVGAQAFECLTGSDSDDDDDHVFASAYDSALREELRGTRVLPEGGLGGPVVVEGGEGDGPEDETDDRANQVKEDVAIIESILTSVKLQEGAPGPATNLMGMLGVSIPRGTLESREDKKKDLG